MSKGLPIARTCGECQACCFSTSVWSETVNSPAGERCPHQCETGCAVYEDRPSPCSAFRCAWLDGWGSDRDRPDKLGLVLEVFSSNAILVSQAHRRAWRGRGRRILLKLAKTRPVVVLGFQRGDEPAFISEEAGEEFLKEIARMSAGDTSQPFVGEGGQL